MKKFEIYAHRGGFPPNRLSAFCFAGSIGVDGIETDVCLTSDDEPIIYHPGTLKPPEPNTQTWKQVLKGNGDCFHLDDLLETLSVYPNLKCLLDIKISSKKLIEKIVPKIGIDQFRQRIFLTAPKKQSYFANFCVDATILEYAKSLDNALKIHIIDTMPLNMAEVVKKYNADMISFGWLNDSLASQMVFNLIFKTGLRNASREVKKIQKERVKAMIGIANTVDEIRGLLNLCPSIDAILTDNPETALSVRDFSIPS